MKNKTIVILVTKKMRYTFKAKYMISNTHASSKYPSKLPVI